MSETSNKMKPFFSVIIFMLFVAGAALSSMHSYKVTKDSIIQDMNQALSQTISQKENGYITPDTIINYRQHHPTIENSTVQKAVNLRRLQYPNNT